MDAVGVGSNGDIGAVVDDQRDAERPEQRDQTAGFLDERAGLRFGIAKLHHRHAARIAACTVAATPRLPARARSVTR